MLKFIVILNGILNDRVERDDKGATMVEYGLMVALIAIIVAVGAAALGIGVDALFDEVTALL